MTTDHSMSATPHGPERWVVNLCPLCRHQDNAHTGNCSNVGKVFAYEQVWVLPENERTRDLSIAYERGFWDAVEECRHADVVMPEDWIERAKAAADDQ